MESEKDLQLKYEKLVLDMLGDRDSITSQDLPLENDDDYLTSMMIVAYCDDNSAYEVEMLEGNIESKRYTIPMFAIRKRQLVKAVSEDIADYLKEVKGYMSKSANNEFSSEAARKQEYNALTAKKRKLMEKVKKGRDM